MYKDARALSEIFEKIYKNEVIALVKQNAPKYSLFLPSALHALVLEFSNFIILSAQPSVLTNSSCRLTQLCSLCGKGTEDGKTIVSCQGECLRSFHPECLGTSSDEYSKVTVTITLRILLRMPQDWVCDECINGKKVFYFDKKAKQFFYFSLSEPSELFSCCQFLSQGFARLEETVANAAQQRSDEPVQFSPFLCVMFKLPTI